VRAAASGATRQHLSVKVAVFAHCRPIIVRAQGGGNAEAFWALHQSVWKRLRILSEKVLSFL
jgi:hypothetical protein